MMRVRFSGLPRGKGAGFCEEALRVAVIALAAKELADVISAESLARQQVRVKMQEAKVSRAADFESSADDCGDASEGSGFIDFESGVVARAVVRAAERTGGLKLDSVDKARVRLAFPAGERGKEAACLEDTSEDEKDDRDGQAATHPKRRRRQQHTSGLGSTAIQAAQWAAQNRLSQQKTHELMAPRAVLSAEDAEMQYKRHDSFAEEHGFLTLDEIIDILEDPEENEAFVHDVASNCYAHPRGILYDSTNNTYWYQPTGQYFGYSEKLCQFVPIEELYREAATATHDDAYLQSGEGHHSPNDSSTAKRKASHDVTATLPFKQKKTNSTFETWNRRATELVTSSRTYTTVGKEFERNRNPLGDAGAPAAASMFDDGGPHGGAVAHKALTMEHFVAGAPDEIDALKPTQIDNRMIVGTVCLLCKRRMKNEQCVLLHLQRSRLHQDNLAIQQEMKKQRSRDRTRASAALKEAESVDRIQHARARAAVVEAALTERGADLNSRNKGAQLLAKLGYHSGEKLGASQATRASVIEPDLRPKSRLGLGANDDESR